MSPLSVVLMFTSLSLLALIFQAVAISKLRGEVRELRVIMVRSIVVQRKVKQ